jgi:hypothetical protein
VGSEDDKKLATEAQAAQPARSGRFADVFASLNKAAQSSFVKRLLATLGDSAVPRGTPGVMTPTQAQQMAMQLDAVLAGLSTACADQSRRLANGPMPWNRVNAPRVLTSLQALAGITDRLAQAMAGFTSGQQPTSNRAQVSSPERATQVSPDTGPTLAVVRLGDPQQRISPEQIQRVAESLRNVHQYVINVAAQIRSSVAGLAGTNPFALDGALAEVNMLVLVLRDAQVRLREMLAGTADYR